MFSWVWVETIDNKQLYMHGRRERTTTWKQKSCVRIRGPGRGKARSYTLNCSDFCDITLTGDVPIFPWQVQIIVIYRFTVVKSLIYNWFSFQSDRIIPSLKHVMLCICSACHRKKQENMYRWFWFSYIFISQTLLFVKYIFSKNEQTTEFPRLRSQLWYWVSLLFY